MGLAALATAAASQAILPGTVSLLRAPTPLLLLFGLACASPAPSTPAPAVPSNPSDVEAQGRAPRGEITLHPIAAREGNLDLASADGHAYLLIDGEPIPLAPGRAPERQPDFGRGLAPGSSAFSATTLVAFGGSPERGAAYVVTREDMDRAGSQFETVAYGPDGWRAQNLYHKGLQGYYQAILSLPGDVLLGVRGFEFDLGELPEIAHEDSPEANAWWAELESQRAAAPSGFVVLAGSPTQVPELPPGWLTTDAVATTDGRIVALAYEALPADPSGNDTGTTPPVRLLDWAPGQTRPEIRSLPELDPETPAWATRLWPAGEQVIASAWTGAPMDANLPYLALGRGDSWTRVPVDLPGLAEDAQTISSATLDDAGELWVTVGPGYYDPEADFGPSLWRRSGGTWLPVELPEIGAELWQGRPRWFFTSGEERWIELSPGADQPSFNPLATQVRWHDGELWVVAKVGRVYPDAEDFWAFDARAVAYASRPVEAPVLLPGFDQIELERIDARVSGLAPGEPGCQRFTVVIADRPTADRRAEIVARATALAGPPATETANAHALYLGAPLDDPSHTQLVYDAYAWARGDAPELLTTIASALGAQVQADCRPRTMVEMLVP